MIPLMSKSEIRAEGIKRRNALPETARKLYSLAISDKICLAKPWQKAMVVMGYASFGSEVETDAFLKATLDAGKTLVLPRVNRETRKLDVFVVTDLDTGLEQGSWGIREPRIETCTPIAYERIEFILIPGVAFDRSGGRIGYGKGFYDRLLHCTRRRGGQAFTAGASFEIQLVDGLPRERHDVLLDRIITEASSYPGGLSS